MIFSEGIRKVRQQCKVAHFCCCWDVSQLSISFALFALNKSETKMTASILTQDPKT